MFSPPLVHYILIKPRLRQTEPSQFQFFTPEWLSLYSVFVALLQGPTTFNDLVAPLSERVSLRASGIARFSFAVAPADVLKSVAPVPFMVLVTDEPDDPAGREYCASHQEPVLHLPTKPNNHEVGLFDATPLTFRRWYDRVLKYLELAEPDAAAAFQEYEAKFRDASFDAPVREMVLATTVLSLPNDLALASIRYPNYRETHESANSEAAAQPLILRSYRQVREVRERCLTPQHYRQGSTELVLVNAGMARSLPRAIPRSLRVPGDDQAEATYRRLIANETFFLPDGLPTDERSETIVNHRGCELQSTMLAAAIEACSQFAAVVPILKDVRSSRAPLKRLANELTRKSGQWRRRACSAAHAVGHELAAALPDFLRSELKELRGTIKVLSDDPFELLTAEDRPLSLLRPTVRLPTTPGFVLEQLLRLAYPIFLKPSDFSEILVLRGTSADDPVFPWLEHFTSRALRGNSGISLSVVDVRSVEEMAAALNRYRGAMAIFDAHGFHPDRSVGKLVFGNSAANPLESPLPFNVPPIVYLAACDTHAVNRGQETVALSLLLSGARTVIGTLGPVGAIESAILCAELMIAIRAMVPIFPFPVRWSELFWMVAGAAHVGEGAMVLRSEGLLRMAPEDVQRIHTYAMKAIATSRPRWFQESKEELGRLAGVTLGEIESMWRSHAYLTDSVLHTQLGHADSIYLTPSDAWVEKFTNRRAQFLSRPDE